ILSEYTVPLSISAALFFNPTPSAEIYPLSLHDALPISPSWASPSNDGEFRLETEELRGQWAVRRPAPRGCARGHAQGLVKPMPRSEEHTSELQSRENLVCRLLLEKKKKNNIHHTAQQSI